MEPTDVNELQASLRNLDELFTLGDAEPEIGDLLERVVKLASEGIATVDSVSITISDMGSPRTACASDEVARKVDEAQYSADEGPCIDSMRDGVSYQIDDMTQDERWRKFSAEALKHNVLSTLALPLRVEGRTVGALNLYSGTADSFGETEKTIASIFASRAAVGLANADVYRRTRETIVQLEEAIQTRDVIGEAKGILMATEGCTDEEAFRMLVTASQHGNRKLREIARELVTKYESKNGPRG